MTEKISADKTTDEKQDGQILTFLGRTLKQSRLTLDGKQNVIRNGDRLVEGFAGLLAKLSRPIYTFVCDPVELTINYDRAFWTLFDGYWKPLGDRGLEPGNFEVQPTAPQRGTHHGIYRIAQFGDPDMPHYEISCKKALGLLKAAGWKLADSWALERVINTVPDIMPVGRATPTTSPHLLVGPSYKIIADKSRSYAVSLQKLRFERNAPAQIWVDIWPMSYVGRGASITSGDFLLVEKIS